MKQIAAWMDRVASAPADTGLHAAIAGEQDQHGRAVDLEHQGLDDGADRDAAGLGRVLGGAGRRGELDDAVAQALRRQGGPHALHRGAGEEHAHAGRGMPWPKAGTS